MEVNRKFDFRRVWKFCWDLSNVISGGNWLFRSDCVFQVGLCTRLRTISALESLFISILSSILLRYFELPIGDFVLLAERLLSTLYWPMFPPYKTIQHSISIHPENVRKLLDVRFVRIKSLRFWISQRMRNQKIVFWFKIGNSYFWKFMRFFFFLFVPTFLVSEMRLIWV